MAINSALSTQDAALLPDDFQFSQSSLQEFVDCPALFYLRHVLGLRYPAPEAEPLRDSEANVERGLRFHQLIHQHGLGIPADALEATISDDVLAQWWAAYRSYDLTGLPATRRWETTLAAPLAGRRLAARFDLLALSPERAVIVDWKTALRRPTRESLQRRLQTVVYPYLLARAGAHLNGGQPIAPDSIEMTYWFAEFPRKPETFSYSAAQFERDSTVLEALAADILGRTGESAFELTDDIDRCRYCSFRSLHQRGTSAGDFHALDADASAVPGIDLDLEQIAELEF